MTSAVPIREIATTCPYCGVGCGVLAATDGERIIGVRGDPAHPANFGRLCSKGSTLHLTARAGDRLLHPELRDTRDAPRQSVNWDVALDAVANRFATIIREHGPDAVAFYGSGQLLTEDYYVFNKLARALVGTNNIDTNSRLCMSSAVAGYKATLGSDAVPGCYEDIDHADLFFIAGSNTAWAHPIVMRRIEAAREQQASRMIVVDPRRTETAAMADLHLAILPGTDVALFHAMLHWLIWEDKIASDYIAQHTRGFADLRTLVREMSPAAAARICGVREEHIITAAQWWSESKAVMSLYCQGLNQSTSGTAKNAALINLHLATAQIGRLGAAPFSLTGQPNAMGGREVGALANLLPGHRDVANATHREELAKLWGIRSIPERPGKTAVEMFDAIAAGEIKAVWIACTNPAQSLPNTQTIKAALKRAGYVVVQDAFASSETLTFADVVLPATTWGEKSGTVTNSERRISRVRSVLPAPGEARHDWQIFRDVAQRLECELRPNEPSLFAFDSTETIWNEHRALTATRDLDITGLSYAALEQDGPQQWPYAPGASNGATRLFSDGVFATGDGKARFFAESYKPVAESVSAAYPIALTTGRLRDQWHSMTRSGRAASLFGHAERPEIELSANDMARRAISDGDLVRIQSRRGSFVAYARADDSVRSGQAFVPMHWGESFVVGRDTHGVNGITQPAFCARSKQPELKHAAVKLERVDATWQVAAMARAEPEQLEHLRTAWLAHARSLTFAHAVPVQGITTALWLVGANGVAMDETWLAAFDALIGVTGAETLVYDDERTKNARRVSIVGDALVAARVSGRVDAARWLRGLLLNQESVRPVARWLLAPAPPKNSQSTNGRTVCTCFGVSEAAIQQCLSATDGSPTERLRALQSQHKCGTNCGSCLPELKRMAQRSMELASSAA